MSCKVPDNYEDGTLNDVFIEFDDESIRHALRHYCAQNL